MPDDSAWAGSAETPSMTSWSNQEARIAVNNQSHEATKLLKRAIRKIKRDTGKIPSLQQLADLLQKPLPDLRALIETCAASESSATFKEILTQILAVKTKQKTEPAFEPGHGGRFRAGQNLASKVLAREPGGYAVIIPKYNLRGFLPTEAILKIGEEVLAQYVCVHNNRILLSARMAADAPVQARLYQSENMPSQLNKFNVGKQAACSAGIRMRRATDLFLPPLDKTQEPNRMRIGQADDLLWLITDLEGGQRTACVKAFCESQKSRSAVLLYKGRVVACTYANRQTREALPIESSLQLMLTDCQTPDTQLLMYSLPEELTLAMSAFFLGYPVERTDDLDSLTYMDYIMSWFLQKEQTACLAFSLPANQGTLFALVYKGSFIGSYYVETQEFSRDINFVYELIQQDSQSRLQAFVLAPEQTASSARIGLSLSQNMPKFDF